MLGRVRIARVNNMWFLWDVSFVLWLITNFAYDHTIISIAALIMFVGLTAMYLMRNRHGFPRMGSSIIFYLLFIAFAYLNIATGHTISVAESRRLLPTLGLNVLFYMVIFYYVRNIGIQRFKDVSVIAAVIASVTELLINYRSVHTFVIREGSAVNGNALAICDAIIICWVLCDGEFRKQRMKNSFVVVFLCLFCLLSGTRKALLALAIGIILFVLLNKPGKTLKKVLIISLILFCGIYAIMEIPFLYKLIGYRMDSLISLLQGGSGEASEQTRMRLIEIGFQYFSQNKIWGYGINCFKLFREAHGYYSHNNYIELLCCTGIIGTVLYYAMYFPLIKTGIKKMTSNRDTNTVLGMCFIVVLLFTDIGRVSYYSKGTFMYLTLCYFLIHSEAEQLQQHKS